MPLFEKEISSMEFVTEKEALLLLFKIFLTWLFCNTCPNWILLSAKMDESSKIFLYDDKFFGWCIHVSYRSNAISFLFCMEILLF